MRDRDRARTKPSFLLPADVLSQQTPATQTALGETGGSWNGLRSGTDTTGSKTTCAESKARAAQPAEQMSACSSDEPNSAFAYEGVRLLRPHQFRSRLLQKALQAVQNLSQICSALGV